MSVETIILRGQKGTTLYEVTKEVEIILAKVVIEETTFAKVGAGVYYYCPSKLSISAFKEGDTYICSYKDEQRAFIRTIL